MTIVICIIISIIIVLLLSLKITKIDNNSNSKFFSIQILSSKKIREYQEINRILLIIRDKFINHPEFNIMGSSLGFCRIAYNNLSTKDGVLFENYLKQSMSKKFLGITYKSITLQTYIWATNDRQSRLDWLDKHITKTKI